MLLVCGAFEKQLLLPANIPVNMPFVVQVLCVQVDNIFPSYFHLTVAVFDIMLHCVR